MPIRYVLSRGIDLEIEFKNTLYNFLVDVNGTHSDLYVDCSLIIIYNILATGYDI